MKIFAPNGEKERYIDKNVTQTESMLENGWTVWSVNGRIDIATSDEAYEKGDEILKRAGKLVLDMSEVSYLSSARIRIIVRLFKKSQNLSFSGIIRAQKATKGKGEEMLNTFDTFAENYAENLIKERLTERAQLIVIKVSQQLEILDDAENIAKIAEKIVNGESGQRPSSVARENLIICAWKKRAIC